VTDDVTNDTAGAGSPVPAVSSVHPAGHDVVPEAARREVDRIRDRWAQLSLARAESALPAVRAVLADLAARTAGDDAVVPDLGAGVVVDQLAVLVWDAHAAGRAEGVAEALADLRRSLP
jgi:hypothetical protein